MSELTSVYNEYPIGSNSWWLNEPTGATIFDKCILIILKVIFLGARFSLRLALGRKRRDRLYLKRDINFRRFLYNAINLLGLCNSFLIKFTVPKYNYEVSCRINKEDFIIMSAHEDEIIEHFCPKEGDIVVDVGAHYGRYTIIGSKRVGINGKVIAIEAHPGNFDILNRNIQLNRLTNVIPLNYAVYSQRTKIKLYLPDEDLGYTMHHSVMFSYLSTKYKLKDNEGKFVEVIANTLDSLLEANGISQANWIKIDVEGAELEVLRGGHNILSNSNDLAILVEVHDGLNNYRPVIDLLTSYNFTVLFEKSYEGGEKHIIVRKSSGI